MTGDTTESAKRRARLRAVANRQRADVRRILYGARDVPEAEKPRLDRYIDDRFGDLAAWTPDRLGQELGLTFEIRHRLGVRVVRCIDFTPDEVSDKYRDGRKPADAERKRVSRQQARAAKAGATRGAVVLKMITGAEWISTVTLAEKTERLSQFRKSEGGRMDRHSRRRALNRVLDELVADGVIVERDPKDCPAGPTGLKARWVKRQIPAAAERAQAARSSAVSW